MTARMIQWSSSLETGHAMVDNDHKRLIDQLNQLSEALQRGAGKEEITGMIVFLNSYAREHFAREETHMQRIGCPVLNENCRAHALFLSKLSGWIERLRSAGASTSLVLEVHRESCAWIKSHIVGIDCKLRGCRTA
ncbi:MAG TPA: hemerythrin family protein [Opitutaceae bacterium]|nr:hemerythrin family protein [Opitutaceae bacterium]